MPTGLESVGGESRCEGEIESRLSQTEEETLIKNILEEETVAGVLAREGGGGAPPPMEDPRALEGFFGKEKNFR